uniref:ADP-ribosylhydrolase ARH3 n=2 Tax=Lygus hesperus TaxID=30085 RepID=A0A146L887_LYGHE
MVVPVLETAVVVNKFRGCLLGSLLGDCLGAPFENESKVAKVVLQRYFDKMEDPNFKSPQKQYTDDTAMTKSVAESLVQHGAFNEKDLAKRFTTEYFQSPRRGYGQAVVGVFRKWRDSKMEDVWRPAREQFDGEGSAGNGAAMRISPISLFCYKDRHLLVQTAADCSKLTHTHRLGVHGAILQALAIQQCVLHGPEESIDVKSFSTSLIEKMSEVEPHEEDELCDMGDEPQSYQKQLNFMQKLLNKNEADPEVVVEALGNTVLSLYSVPAAIYCFLRAQRPIEFIQTDNVFRRVIQFAISLGGDTDTIASMAGAMAGAHLGVDAINPSLMQHCEAHQFVDNLACDLADVALAP